MQYFSAKVPWNVFLFQGEGHPLLPPEILQGSVPPTWLSHPCSQWPSTAHHWPLPSHNQSDPSHGISASAPAHNGELTDEIFSRVYSGNGRHFACAYLLSTSYTHIYVYSILVQHNFSQLSAYLFCWYILTKYNTHMKGHIVCIRIHKVHCVHSCSRALEQPRVEQLTIV